MARLIIYENSNGDSTIFETFELATTRILIGSDPDNNLVLQAPAIDPSHASLELRNDSWVLQDLGGPGGTDVNGRMIAGPYLLSHNDLIKLGPVKMTFLAEELAPKVPTPPTTPLPPAVSSQATAPLLKGRVWFALVAAGTLGIIFVIVFLLVVADYLNVLEITDLLPLLSLLLHAG